MFKQLPEEIMMNVSSFLLGTPADMRMKNTKALKRVQKNYRLKIDNVKVERINETERWVERTSIMLKNTSLSNFEVMDALKQRLHLLKSRMDYTLDSLAFDMLVHDDKNHRCLQTGYQNVKINGVVIRNEKALDKLLTKIITYEIPDRFKPWRHMLEQIDRIELLIYTSSSF